jgi:ABC-type lipoprotein export system ATPase subunit
VTVTDSAITADGIEVSFRRPDGGLVEIAHDFALTLGVGDSLCLAGRSGSGKTSILRVLAGLAQPRAGTVSWWGTSLSAMDESALRVNRRTRVGYLDQDASLIDDLTALENVLVPALPDGKHEVRSKRHRAVDLLERLGLHGQLASTPASLSGGERQRVALARAMVMRPGILMADEPTASLDRHWAGQVIALLEEFTSAGGTLIAASHDTNVMHACQQVRQIE